MTFDSEDEVELALPDGRLELDEEHDPFMSKIGGKPTWLKSPSSINKETYFKCDKCSSPLYLLLQMDCPLPRTYHIKADRVFFVFACNTRVCTESGHPGTVKCYFQIKMNNSAKTNNSQSQNKGLWDSFNSGPADLNQVSSNFEQMNMKDVAEEEEYSCDLSYPVQFPSHALRIIDELIAIHPPINTKQKFNSDDIVVEEKAENWEGEGYEKMIIPGIDKAFKAFQKRISSYPKQCVRYSPGGRPLLYSDENISEIPKCSKCNQERHFELQLMPAVLSLLPCNEKSYLSHIPLKKRSSHPLYGDGMEWGTILVYSCKTCLLSNNLQLVESEAHVIVQKETE